MFWIYTVSSIGSLSLFLYRILYLFIIFSLRLSTCDFALCSMPLSGLTIFFFFFCSLFSFSLTFLIETLILASIFFVAFTLYSLPVDITFKTKFIIKASSDILLYEAEILRKKYLEFSLNFIQNGFFSLLKKHLRENRLILSVSQNLLMVFTFYSLHSVLANRTWFKWMLDVNLFSSVNIRHENAFLIKTILTDHSHRMNFQSIIKYSFLYL